MLSANATEEIMNLPISHLKSLIDKKISKSPMEPFEPLTMDKERVTESEVTRLTREEYNQLLLDEVHLESKLMDIRDKLTNHIIVRTPDEDLSKYDIYKVTTITRSKSSRYCSIFDKGYKQSKPTITYELIPN